MLALAYRSFLAASPDENTNIYLQIIQNNVSIPVVITDDKGNISLSVNLPPNQQGKTFFDDEMLKEYSIYPPIKIDLFGKTSWLYYNESLIYTELKDVLNDLFQFFIDDVTSNAVGAPVIIIDSSNNEVLSYGNLDPFKMMNKEYVREQLEIMRSQHKPIKVSYLNQKKAYIYYRSSDLLMQMKYYPYIQILVMTFFLIVAYLLFSYARRSEQNQVWAGMAKETAHQIGTPLSSLIGWIELLKLQETEFIGTAEMEKDIKRLETITERFSKIGSIPTLEDAEKNTGTVDCTIS